MSEALQALCARWQARLRLQDWRVTVAVVREREMDEPCRQGECEVSASHQEARIRLLDPLDHRPDRWPYMPLEVVLIHELLHLHTAALNVKPGAATTAMEQMVNALAWALFNEEGTT